MPRRRPRTPPDERSARQLRDRRVPRDGPGATGDRSRARRGHDGRRRRVLTPPQRAGSSGSAATARRWPTPSTRPRRAPATPEREDRTAAPRRGPLAAARGARRPRPQRQRRRDGHPPAGDPARQPARRHRARRACAAARRPDGAPLPASLRRLDGPAARRCSLLAAPAPRAPTPARRWRIGFSTACSPRTRPSAGRGCSAPPTPARTSCASTSAGPRRHADPPGRLRRPQPGRPGVRLRARRRRDRRRDRRAGLRVLASFTGAPRWAEGPGRPASADAGSWRPDPPALEDYGAALARRYSGTFPDPARPGRTLPRVDAFQPWNEPNLDKYLEPAVERRQARSRPRHYRRMLTAFNRGVKSVRARARSSSAAAPRRSAIRARTGTASCRRASCASCCACAASSGRLRGTRAARRRRASTCSPTTRTRSAPRAASALNADDVSIPDIGKLTRLLRAAERTGGALPRKRHRMWVTEVSYDSSPPDPQGVPAAPHARFLEQAFYLLWTQGVDTSRGFRSATSCRPRATRPRTSRASTSPTGAPKPAQRAFRFPLVAERAARASLRVWGRAPVAGTVRIERRRGRLAARPDRAGTRHGTFLAADRDARPRRACARGSAARRASPGVPQRAEPRPSRMVLSCLSTGCQLWLAADVGCCELMPAPSRKESP